MRTIAAIWGFIGVCSLIGSAIYRLTPRAIEAINMGLTPFQWTCLTLFAIFMLISEGYRGFQKKFSPRTAARVRYLYDNPHPIRTLLAPLFCMGYFHANKKTKLIAYILTSAIITLVLLVSLCPQPWRGIIDFGVVLGLGWGVSSFIIFTIQAFTSKKFNHSPETP